MPLYVFDILILAILAFFAWRGAKKGLILGVCSLAGIFVAFFGARLISSSFYLPVSNILEPGIYQTVLGAEPQSAADPGTSAPPTYGSEGDLEEPAPTYSLEELLDSIHEAGLFAGLAGFIDEAVSGNAIQTSPAKTPAEALASYIAQLISKAGLFALSFLVILLVWFLVGHILDLTFHLPILSAVSQFFTSKFMNAGQQSSNAQQASTNKFMQWFFPLFSLWICASSNAAFALYWVFINVFQIAQQFIIGKLIDRSENKKKLIEEASTK